MPTPKSAEQLLFEQGAIFAVGSATSHDWLKQSLISFLEDVKMKMPKKLSSIEDSIEEFDGFNQAIDSCLSVINSIQEGIK